MGLYSTSKRNTYKINKIFKRCVGDPKTLLHGYYDADFAGNKLMQKSVSGNIYFFTSKVILYLLKKQ